LIPISISGQKTVRTLNTRTISLLFLSSVLCLAAIAASGPASSISSNSAPAVAWSAGTLRINGADHSGSGNVAPGAKLETLGSAGQLFLPDGTRLRLGANTRLSVESNTIHLESGAARIDSISALPGHLNVSAGELQITASGGTIQRLQPNEIVVSALKTPAAVRKSNGTLIAMVRPGHTIAFAVPANAAKSNETQMTGRISREDNRYFLTDEVSRLKTELQGGQPSLYQGRRVSASGLLIPSGHPDQSKLVVHQIAMANPPSPNQSKDQTPNTAEPARTSPPTSNAPVIVKSTAVLSKTTIAAITVATVGGIGASLGLVNRQSDNRISQ
jgi:hypothetical protein